MTQPPLLIESRQNSRYKMWKKASEGAVRKAGCTLVSGKRIVLEWAGRLAQSHGWLIPVGNEESLPEAPGGFTLLSRELFSELDVFGTRFPMLWVDLEATLRATSPGKETGQAALRSSGASLRKVGPGSAVGPSGDGVQEKERCLCLAVPFQDPANVGAVIRTAVGLGVDAIVLLPSAANPYHPKAVRASAGAVFMAPLLSVGSMEELAPLRLAPLLLDAGGAPLNETEFPERCLLLPGLEGPGVDPFQQAHGSSVVSVSIPMEGIESYNATVACALALYEWRRRNP